MSSAFLRFERSNSFLVVIFLFLPLGFALFLVLALRQDMSVWIFVAMLLFAGIWIFQGYYLEVYLRKLLKMKQSGQSPIVRKPTVHLQRNCIISLLAAWAVWSYGVFVGIWWPLLETCGICVFIYLNIASIYKLWRYRGF